MLPVLQLKSGRPPRVVRGHPWAYAGEIGDLLSAKYDGQAIELRDARGSSLGSGLFNSRSQIAWRRFSYKVRPFDKAFLTEAIGKAVARRNAADRFCRLVWSEADSVPGLIVDRFDAVLVVQAQTLGVNSALPIITEVLRELLAPSEIVFRNDAPARQYEGLNLEVKTASGQPLPADWYRIDGIEYFLDLMGGQKTGFYLDQRAQHSKVGALAAGRRVLDGCCNQGSFALHCAKGGATSVLAVDSSRDCIAASLKNAERNGLRIDAVAENLFDWFGGHRGERFDLIVLDPPSFARNKKALPGALRGYKELNLRALQSLNPGGILATYSCSQSVSGGLFMETLREAAVDARRAVRLLEITGQSPDHPVLLAMPESQYLSGAIVSAD